MRTLIYKRKHSGDPDPETGIFGNHKCMKRVREWPFNAVIGVGGIGREPERKGIARKLTWVGIGPQKVGIGEDGHPLLKFNHFLYYGETGQLLKDVAPALAKRIYDGGVRLIWDISLSEVERKDVTNILDLAKNAPPSGRLEGTPQLNAEKTRGEHRSNSCCRNSAARKAEQENPADAKERRG
jgi:hypothetical protein